MDWLEKNLCIKCNEGGNLLVCSENGCPLAIHERCMGCPARFDDAGLFYCPYCLYKRAVAESRQAREYALARKKALLIFLNEEKKGSEEEILEENKRGESNMLYQPKDSAANEKTATHDDDNNNQPIHFDEGDEVGVAEEENKEEDESEPSECSKGDDPSFKMHEEQKKSNAEEGNTNEGESEPSECSKGDDPSFKMHEEQKKCNTKEGNINEEESEPSECSESDNPSFKMNEEQKKSNAEEGNINEEESEPSECSKGDDPSIKMHGNQKNRNSEEGNIGEEEREDPSLKMHANKICNEEEEKISEELSETSSASIGQDPSLNVRVRPKRGIKRDKPIEKDPVIKNNKSKQASPSVNKRSSRRSSSAVKTNKVLNEKVGTPRRSKQPQQPSAKLEKEIFSSGKRKRLFWREDEEEMLKAGVQKFAKEANKNLPWRKILEFGHHVFDVTRTPGDLRDKWRNMLLK